MILLVLMWLMAPWFLYIQWQKDPTVFQIAWYTISGLATHPITKTQEAFAFWGLEATILWFYPSVVLLVTSLIMAMRR